MFATLLLKRIAFLLLAKSAIPSSTSTKRIVFSIEHVLLVNGLMTQLYPVKNVQKIAFLATKETKMGLSFALSVLVLRCSLQTIHALIDVTIRSNISAWLKIHALLVINLSLILTRQDNPAIIAQDTAKVVCGTNIYLELNVDLTALKIASSTLFRKDAELIAATPSISIITQLNALTAKMEHSMIE